MAIWIMHGIVARADALKLTHRHLLDAARFQRLLETRTSKFVDIDQALAGHGDAITIDDSTSAAADAAEFCRASGHAVTVFVNGRNIALQQTYWFATLNALIDRCEHDSILFQGESFSLRGLPARQRFRTVVKRTALSLHSEETREAFLLTLARNINVDPLAVPRHLATISLERLRHMRAIGVRIENHGWTHGNVAAMSREEIIEDIQAGVSWLRDSAAVEAKHYAVPFGAATLPDGPAAPLYNTWLLADESRPAGRIDSRIVNRVTLSEGPLTLHLPRTKRCFGSR